MNPDLTRQPSSWWVVLSWICAGLTAAAVFGAIALQRESSKPIGEGEVFVADTAEADRLIASTPDPDTGVSKARNTLGIEAVSILDAEGVIVASTSAPWVGTPVQSPLLAFGAADGRLMALASEIEEDLWLDDVVQWPAGTVLYQVVAPRATGGSVVLHYDVSGLLGRRTRPWGLQPMSLQLLGLAVIFGVLTGSVLIGHARAARRYRTVEQESETHRSNSEELTRANASLEQARHQAEEALALAEEKIRIRSEFVLMINHELRTPLTSVVTGAELLRSRDLSDADRTALLDAMVADGSRLQEIIDQILAVARIENRGLSYELVEVPFEDVARALALAHPAAQSDIDPDPGSGILVNTDVGALCLVVASLVDNAFTHGAHAVSVGCDSRPRVVPQIEVGHRPEKAIFITVTDDGPGIEPEFLPRIFEKFEKSSFSSGTGLGLYMARMIVEALEGSLSVQSSAAGTTFQISVPSSSVRARVEVMT